jgi:retinol dehydrogenase 12
MLMPVVLITGTNRGLGLEFTRQYCAAGWQVIATCRDPEASPELAALQREHAGLELHALNVADFATIDQLAATLAGRPIDVLLNNAGVFVAQRERSVDGHELTLAVNHLAPFLLTLLLRAPLRAAVQGRVVNVSSMAHARGRVDLTDLEGGAHFDGNAAYANSKLLNVHFTHELARRFEGTRVTTSALHPGVIDTKLLRAGFAITGAPVERGAHTSVYCATDPGLAKVSGRYYADAREVACAPHANDERLEAELWALSERLVGEAWS